MTSLVIGYGNPLRGDDALGQVVVSRLPTETYICHQLTPDLAPRLATCEVVILVDVREATPVGQLYTEVVQPASEAPVLVHHVTPDVLLTLVHVLYGATPHVVLTGLTSTHFEFGAPLSEPVQARLPALKAHILSLLQ